MVDFPAPLSPINPTISFDPTCRFIFFSAQTRPKYFSILTMRRALRSTEGSTTGKPPCKEMFEVFLEKNQLQVVLHEFKRVELCGWRRVHPHNPHLSIAY